MADNMSDSPPMDDIPFTPSMRDEQSRGKDPYVDEQAASSSSSHAGPSGHAGPSSSKNPERIETTVLESFELRERRQMAMSVLDSPDLLMLIAESEGDSVAGQRQRFTRMVCGYEDVDETMTGNPKSSRRRDRD